MIRLLALLLALGLPAVAEETIVAGMSQNRVSITADFDGSEILIYGAVRREAPPPAGAGPLEVIVTVEGPSTPVTVRRKARVAGIWVNNASVTVDSAPSFYAVATTGPLDHILSDTDNLRHGITIERVIRAVGITDEADKAGEFLLGLLRVRSNEGRYRVLQGEVELTEETLFRSDVILPANLTEGEYKVRLFLLRDTRVIATQERVIGVRKEGLERFIFNLAQEQPLIYGLISLVLAAAAGWGASAAFRLARA
jgi:uncharacterized protein (TIGR02186 family)